MKEKIGNILKERRRLKNLTQHDVAKIVGVTEATVSRWESGDIKNMRRDKIRKLSEVLNLSPAVIMGWSTDRLSVNKTVPAFPYYYIDSPVSAGLMENIESMSSIPQITVPDAILGKYAHDKDIVFIKVNGESMNHVIENGSLVAVKTGIERESLSNGDIVIAENEGSYTVKRFINDTVNRRIILRPDSSDPIFSDIVFDYGDAENLKIIGKVVMYSVIL
jgi:repressor LexA